MANKAELSVNELVRLAKAASEGFSPLEMEVQRLGNDPEWRKFYDNLPPEDGEGEASPASSSGPAIEPLNN